MPSKGYPFKRIYCREHICGTSANVIVRATSRDPRIHAVAPEIAHAWPRDNRRRGRLDRADVVVADRLGLSWDVWAGDIAGGKSARTRVKCQLTAIWAVATSGAMSPTVLRDRGYRFYFFSREELRMHVHVHGPDGEAKFWLEPRVELAHNLGLKPQDMRTIKAFVEDNAHVFRNAWKRHFSG